MTATNHDRLDEGAECGTHHAEALVRQIIGTCRTAVEGRRAARALSGWTRRFDLNEPEFQVLWRLRSESDPCIDQTNLAQCLALSPAQVSAMVERLRSAGWIAQGQPTGDRRRNLWQLTADGHSLLQRMLSDAGNRLIDFGEGPVRESANLDPRKEAA